MTEHGRILDEKKGNEVEFLDTIDAVNASETFFCHHWCRIVRTSSSEEFIWLLMLFLLVFRGSRNWLSGTTSAIFETEFPAFCADGYSLPLWKKQLEADICPAELKDTYPTKSLKGTILGTLTRVYIEVYSHLSHHIMNALNGQCATIILSKLLNILFFFLIYIYRGSGLSNPRVSKQKILNDKPLSNGQRPLRSAEEQYRNSSATEPKGSLFVTHASWAASKKWKHIYLPFLWDPAMRITNVPCSSSHKRCQFSTSSSGTTNV